MVAKVRSGAVVGVEGRVVEVEVDLGQGLPSFDIVGLPDSAVRESRERVRAAIKNAGFTMPAKSITINLAPADIRKEGPSFDLPIAIGVLACIGVVPQSATEKAFVVGELSLDGGVRPVKGVLPLVNGAVQGGYSICAVPEANADEAALVQGARVLPVRDLKQLVAVLRGELKTRAYRPAEIEDAAASGGLDFADVKGQDMVKRALEIAAAGRHNVLMTGPPGSGKTMMAKRMPSILPALTFEESLEVTKIYSVAGLLGNANALIAQRPFRAPHHTISDSALTGGGRVPKPGEISLAHNGVLFLDELPEFHRNVIEVLRQPMEDGYVNISRVNGTMTYPAGFMLIASMNPCPCGYYGEENRCTCSMTEVVRYHNKLSGPLLDRIDIHVDTHKLAYKELDNRTRGESSEAIRERVVRAHALQSARFKAEGVTSNAQLTASQIETACCLDEAGMALMRGAFDILNLSARAYHKILKVARTIADLDGEECVKERHVAEAVQYRRLENRIRT